MLAANHKQLVYRPQVCASVKAAAAVALVLVGVLPPMPEGSQAQTPASSMPLLTEPPTHRAASPLP